MIYFDYIVPSVILVIFKKVQRFALKTALLFEDEKFTFQDLNHKINKVAHTGLKIGLMPGDTVALLINNEPTFIWTYLGKLWSEWPYRDNKSYHCRIFAFKAIYLISAVDIYSSLVKTQALSWWQIGYLEIIHSSMITINFPWDSSFEKINKGLNLTIPWNFTLYRFHSIECWHPFSIIVMTSCLTWYISSLLVVCCCQYHTGT